jgi:hypothetical protein
LNVLRILLLRWILRVALGSAADAAVPEAMD